MSSSNQTAIDMGTLIEIEGTIAAQPVVRTRAVGEGGHPMPVLCLQLNQLGPRRVGFVTCDQVFPLGAHAAAQAAAHRLKPGTRVKVQVPVDLMETHFPATAHIHVLPQPDPATPAKKEAAHA